MRMTVRRYRRRRTGSDALGFTRSPFAPPFFDRLEFLSQSISQPRKTDAPFILLVTEDHYLRTGFLNGQFPLSSCCDYATLDDALSLRPSGLQPVWSWILKADPRGFWRNWIS